MEDRADAIMEMREQEEKDELQAWVDSLDEDALYSQDVIDRLADAGDAITHGRIKRALKDRAKALGISKTDYEGTLKGCGVAQYKPKPQETTQEEQRIWYRGPGSIDYRKFTNTDAKGNPVSVKQNEIFEHIKKHIRIMIFHKKPYIYEHGVFVQDTDGIIDGTRIRKKIEELIYPDLRTARIKDMIYNRFLQDPDLIVGQYDVNCYPTTWINFINGMYDVRSGIMYEHSPKYRSINQIPICYYDKEKYPGDVVEKFLNETLTKPGQRELFEEYCGVAMTPNPAIQKFLMLNGQGGNGKSILIKMFDMVLGDRNVVHVGLEEMTKDRFMTIRMLGMLGNSCGDIRTDKIEDCKYLKQLTGDDRITGQYKGVNSEEFSSYAKLLFSVNGVPKIIGEGSDAIYRRMMILTIDHTPAKPDFNLSKKLEEQKPYFIGLCVKACKRFYEQGGFTACKDSDDAVIRARYNSSSVDAFLALCGYEHGDRDDKIVKTALYSAYKDFCEEEGRIAKSNRDFYKTLQDKGFDTEARSGGERYVRGIKRVPGPEEVWLTAKMQGMPDIPYTPPVQESIQDDGSIMGMSREQIAEHVKKLQEVQAQISAQMNALMALLTDGNDR